MDVIHCSVMGGQSTVVHAQLIASSTITNAAHN